MRTTLVSAVKELLERHWDVAEIAIRLGVDIQTIQAILDILT
jgi:hypothetical protein